MTEALGRRERKKRETRQAIAMAALRLFTERSFEHVTIAEIAEAADVSVNTVFNYFPTKEALFFGQHQPMEAGLAQLIRTRQPGEPLVTFLRQHLTASLEHFLVRAPVHQQGGLETGQMIQRSPALQAHVAQLAQQIEQDLAQALAQDMQAGPDDITPRLVASQVLALYATLFAEGERRRLAGQPPEEIHTALQAAARTGLHLLEHGIETYGSQP